MNELSHRTIEANGIHLHIAEQGRGPLVLLCHGFPESWYSWRHQLRALAQGGFHAIAPDMRGYGHTDHPAEVERYSLLHLVGDMVGLLDALGEDSAAIAGHDWGALVAWFFAGRHPEMTKTLTVLSVAHPAALADASRVDQDQRDRSRYVALFLEVGKAEHVLADEDQRRLRAMFALGPNPEAVPRAIVDHFAHSLSRPGRMTAALNYYRANLGAGGGAWAALTQELKIAAPTALLWGDQDPALGRRAVEATARRVDGPYRLEVLEGAGHWLQFERPAEVSLALTAAASK